MRKLILSFCIMSTILLSGSVVFAATVKVSDTEYFRKGNYDNAYATLSGWQDDVTFRLSNVQTSKKEYGSATATFGQIEKGSTWANVRVTFNYLGENSTRLLEIYCIV